MTNLLIESVKTFAIACTIHVFVRDNVRNPSSNFFKLSSIAHCSPWVCIVNSSANKYAELRSWHSQSNRQNYCDVKWPSWSLELPVNRMFVQHFVWTDKKETSKVHVTVPVRGIHQWLVDSPHKGTVTWNTFPFDDIIMNNWKDDQNNDTDLLYTNGRSINCLTAAYIHCQHQNSIDVKCSAVPSKHCQFSPKSSW